MSHLWEKKFFLGLLGLWVFMLLIWPVPTNLRFQREAERHTASLGEGLYKSDLTNANFGLLGVRFYESSQGEKSWNIRSEFAELHRRNKDYAFMKKVEADFFAGPTRNVVHTNSDYGRSYLGKRRVELEGNVRVDSRQGYRFEMNRLDYNGATHHFHSQDPIQMRGPDLKNPQMLLTGEGLDADLAKESFLVKRNTRARRRLSSRSSRDISAIQWLRIQSESGLFFTETQRAIFKKKVKAVLPEIQIDSDHLEISLNGESELLRARGRVVLIHKNRRGTSETADIEIATDRIILEGNARIQTEDNELRGRRITLHTDGDKVEVEDAHGSMSQ